MSENEGAASRGALGDKAMARRGKGRTPNASCKSGQALEKAQNGNGRLFGKSWHGFGFGAMSAWGSRRAGFGIDGTMLPSQRDKSQEGSGSKKQRGETPIWRLAPFTILALRFEIPFIFYYPPRM